MAVLTASPFVVLTLIFAIEVTVGLFSRARPASRPRPAAAVSRPVTAIVIPSHDEAAIIGASLAALRAELGPGMRMLVVADNCMDDTADIARAGGAAVIERTDAARRGKGFALAFARDHLSADPPECVIVLDADCATDRASLEVLAAAAVGGQPVQSVNLLRPDLAAAPMVQVSNYAFLVKNLVRQTGLFALSGHVHLTGTGMAFPWPIFASAALATDDVVEDLGLGLDLSRSGAAPTFAANAFVWSGASGAHGTLTQRTRWEGGFLSTSLRRAPGLVRHALRTADPRGLWAGLSLMVPPLALLGLANAAAAAVGGALVLFGASTGPLVVQFAVGAFAAASVAAAWIKVGRPFLSPAAAARLPLYVLWKLPLYAGLLKRSPKIWLRTGR